MTALPRRHLQAALEKCRLLDLRGFASTVGFWGRIEHDSAEVAAEYLACVHALDASPLDCYLSVKPLALAFRRDLLMELVRQAHERRVRVHFDSPSAELASITFAAIDEAAGAGGHPGCTLPGRWRRSLDDAEWAVERGLTVRVVKGQWADPDDAAHDPVTGFLDVVDRVAGRARHVSVATHDAPLAYEALRRLQQAGTSCELELLVGQPAGGALGVARLLGAGVRGYVAYGDGTLLYGSGLPGDPPPRLPSRVRPLRRVMPASSRRPWPRSDARAHV